MRLFIVRHGQTAWNITGRSQGHTDIPLDDIGLAQARALAAGFTPGVKIETVYSSDLLRASQTAEILAGALEAKVEFRADLRERCFGVCEGLLFPDMMSRLNKLSEEMGVPTIDVTPPGGESFAQVWDRLDGLVAEINARTEPVVVVTHGGTGGVLAARMVQGNVITARSFHFGNTGVTEFERRDDGSYKIVRYNDVSHLDRDLAAA